MKKVLAVLLVMAMLIPVGLSVPAKAEEVAKDPFYVISWSDFDETKYPYLNGFVTANWSSRGENAHLSAGSAAMEYSKYTDADVTALATVLKDRLAPRAEGSRVVHFFGPAKLYKLAPENAIFMDFYVGQMTEMVDALLKKMKENQTALSKRSGPKNAMAM